MTSQFPMMGGRHNRIVELLSRNRVVFGWFASATDVDAAKRAARDPLMDFVFINMESVASYNPPAVKAFIHGMLEAGLNTNPNDHPLMIRLPIVHTDPAAARLRTAEILNLGAHAIVFPDMESVEEATQALASMRYAKTAADSKAPAPAGQRPDTVGDAGGFWGMSDEEYRMRADLYPLNPIGELASVFIIESQKGVANSREITRLRPTIAIPGPGTLSRVYAGDIAKVEQAIQAQLASCKEFQVPCGITANAADVERRIKEGFRVIIMYDRDFVETVRIGRRAAGR